MKNMSIQNTEVQTSITVGGVSVAATDLPFIYGAAVKRYALAFNETHAPGDEKMLISLGMGLDLPGLSELITNIRSSGMLGTQQMRALEGPAYALIALPWSIAKGSLIAPSQFRGHEYHGSDCDPINPASGRWTGSDAYDVRYRAGSSRDANQQERGNPDGRGMGNPEDKALRDARSAGIQLDDVRNNNSSQNR